MIIIYIMLFMRFINKYIIYMINIQIELEIILNKSNKLLLMTKIDHKKCIKMI